MKTVADYMKKQNPNVLIDFAISAQYFPLIEKDENINQVYDLPIDLDIWQDHHFPGPYVHAQG